MFSAHAFSPAAFLTQYMLRDRCSAMRPAVELPAAWEGFVLPTEYVCPMCAQLALLRGAAWVHDGGRLLIGGAVLLGRAGGVFGFATPATAARWVQLNQDRAAMELEALALLSAGESDGWKAGRRLVLAEYGRQVVERAAGMQDPDKRAALIAESNFSALKWA